MGHAVVCPPADVHMLFFTLIAPVAAGGILAFAVVSAGPKAAAKDLVAPGIVVAAKLVEIFFNVGGLLFVEDGGAIVFNAVFKAHEALKAGLTLAVPFGQGICRAADDKGEPLHAKLGTAVDNGVVIAPVENALFLFNHVPADVAFDAVEAKGTHFRHKLCHAVQSVGELVFVTVKGMVAHGGDQLHGPGKLKGNLDLFGLDPCFLCPGDDIPVPAGNHPK